MKTLLITQARIGSSRLPSKVLLRIGDRSLLDIHLSRIMRAKKVDKIVVATTTEEGSKKICEIAQKRGADCYQGSLNDVLDRFYQAAIPHQPDWVVRVTSDCPILDPEVIDMVVQKAIEGNYDYSANTLVEDFPDGQDVEVFKMSALEKAWKEADMEYEREHVTPFIRINSDFNGGTLFRAADVPAPYDYNKVRMTVDEPADLDMMNWLIKECGQDRTWVEYVTFMLKNPEMLVNADIIRNEGYLKSRNKG